MTHDRRFRALTGSLFSLITLLAGCSAGNTGGAQSNGNPGGGTAATAPSGTALFVGDWATITSNSSITCNGKSATDSSMSDLTWKASSNPGQIYTVEQVAGTSCNIVATVDGQMATAAPGQTCTLSQSGSCGTLTLTLSLTSYAFDVTGTNMAHESYAYSAQGNCSGTAVTCTVNGSADLQKL